MKSLPFHQSISLVHRGNSTHYAFIRRHAARLRKENKQLYLYQREPIDIFFQMLKKKTNVITYITRYNWQTIQATPISKQNDKQYFTEYNNSQALTQFMVNNRLAILKSYLDVHPYEAYHKICAFSGADKSQQYTKIFSYCNFSLTPISSNIQIVPLLSYLNHKYLDTSQLKLRKLDRIRKATPQQLQQSLKKWKQAYMVEGIYSSTKEDQEFKRKYAVESHIGQYVNVDQLVEGYGEKSYYAPWN